MKIRSQLTLAFSLLAIVPLGALTVYSYSSSIRAYRQAVQEEGALRAEEMRQRMATVRSDLDQRMNRARMLPLLELGDTDGSVDSAEAQRTYAYLVNELGELAPFLEHLAIRPVRPPRPSRSTEAKGNAEEADSLLIYIPGMAGLQRIPGLSDLPCREQSDAEALARTCRFVVNGRTILPQLANQLGSLKQMQVADAESLAKVIAVAGEKGDVARIVELSMRLRENARGQHQADLKARLEPPPSAPVPVAPVYVAAPPRGGTSRDYDVTVEGEPIGTVRAEFNVPAVMSRILPLSRRAQGETPFAVDTQGHLYAPSDSERSSLVPLGIAPGHYSGTAPGDPEWVVVSTEDSATGLTFGIARPISEGLEEIRRTAARNLGMGLSMIALAMVGVVQFSKRMTANLSVLTHGAQRLATGNLDHRVPITSKDEFGVLAQTFNLMANQLSENQQRVIEQERLERELELCRQIQTEMLPKAPLRLPFAEIRGVSIPARQVGGDFFNFFPLPDGRVAVLVGDVSGKGVPAALLMANMQAWLSARLPLAGSLVDLAGQLDGEISQSTPAGTFLTLFIGLIDHHTMTLRWLNAGHDAPYVIRGTGDLVPLAATGRPLGILPGGSFSEEMVGIHPGDSLFLYTDGLVEAFSPGGEEFGTRRLEDILRLGGTSSLEQILSRVDAAARTHRGEVEAHDDTTMVAVKMV